MSQDLHELSQHAERYADQLPWSTSMDEALEIAIKAAETSMQALRLATDPNEKARLSTRFKQLLREAERIKLSKDWRKEAQSAPTASRSRLATSTPSATTDRTLVEPQSARQLPTSEQILFLKAGYLNGFKFPPWTIPPAPGEFELKEGENLHEYVLLMSVFPFVIKTLTVSSTETSRSLPFPSFRKMSLMVGSALQRHCLRRRGFRVIESTWVRA